MRAILLAFALVLGALVLAPSPALADYTCQASGTWNPNNAPYWYPLCGANGSGGAQVRKQLTSASATSCTNIDANAGQLFSITNTGPALTVYLQLYDDVGTCLTADLIYGDGATVFAGGGQVVSWQGGLPLTAGLSYTLTGNIPSGQKLIFALSR